MVLALGIAHSAEAAQAQRQVTDITNELLRKNAETQMCIRDRSPLVQGMILAEI